MADFQIVQEQHTRFVRAILDNETIRAEAGALAYTRGAVSMRAPVPGPRQFVRSALSDEAVVRPSFTGTGEVVLESSVGGFHAFEMTDKPWILERGAYWASEGQVTLEVYRERAWNSFWMGTGFIEFLTQVSGRGKVVLSAQGPVEEIELGDEEMAVDGPFVIARSARVAYSLRRPSKSMLSSWISGEGLLRVYRGPGRVLMSSTPYWNRLLLDAVKA